MTEPNAGPLAGLKVLDLTEHMARPFCTMILADMGAEIVKLERPGRGDSVRAWGDGSERNPYFRYINRNKKGITLDYKQQAGKELFLRLVADMDVLVENYRPNVMPRAGLGFADLHRVNPRLIYAQLSGLGYDGPYAGRGGFDLIAQGMGGIMHVTGEPDGPPTSVGLPICDLGTGMWAAQGILAALYERQRTGEGRLVECSLLETAIGFSSWTSAQWLADGQEPTRQGSRHRQNAPYQRMRTKDGYLMIGAAGEAIWARCAEALGHPEWCDDPRFATNRQRLTNRAALESVMEDVLAAGTTEHWVAVLDAAGVPCGPVYDYARMFADPQVRHRGLIQYASDPEIGEVPHIRTPVKIGEGVRVRTVAPRLGEHNREIFSRLGLTETEIEKRAPRKSSERCPGCTPASGALSCPVRRRGGRGQSHRQAMTQEVLMQAGRLNAYEVAPAATKALQQVEAYLRQSGLDRGLIELVKMRASQINGCAYCLDMHSKELRRHGESEQRLYVLSAWHESPAFTARERAALGWTEALTLIAQTHAPDADYAEVRRHFDDKELADLTILIGMINLWNRLAIGFRYPHPVEAAA